MTQYEYEQIKSLNISSVSFIAMGRVLDQLRNGNIIHSKTTVERLILLADEFQKAERINYEIHIGRTVEETLG